MLTLFILVEVINGENDELIEKNLQLEANLTYDQAEQQLKDYKPAGNVNRTFAIKKVFIK